MQKRHRHFVTYVSTLTLQNLYFHIIFMSIKHDTERLASDSAQWREQELEPRQREQARARARSVESEGSLRKDMNSTDGQSRFEGLCFALFPPLSKTDKTVKLNGTQTQKSTVKILRFLEVLASKGDMIQPCELDCQTQTHVE